MKRLVYILFLFCSFCYLSAQSVYELNKSGVDKVRSGDYDGAEYDFNYALKKSDKESALVYHNIAVSYQKEGKNDLAIKYFEEAIKRNPKQIESYERAVMLHYKLGSYSRAVVLGKRGMKVDPDNQIIPKWLNQANNKNIKQEKEQIFRASKKFRYPEKHKYTFGIESGIIAGLYNSPFSFALVSNAGLVPLTTKFYAQYYHNSEWGFRLITENPHNGSIMNDKMVWKERVECYYDYKRYYIGGGILGSHFNGEHFGKKNDIYTDIKLGFVYGYRGPENKVDLYWYPRMLPSDTGMESDQVVDSSELSVEYYRANNYLFDLYAAAGFYEYYYFDNRRAVTHFDGHYDFSVGFLFFNHAGSAFKILTYLTETIYFEDYNNERPFESFNGQGSFGINTEEWFFGDPFSGIKSVGSKINGKFIEVLNDNITLYQKVSFEYVPATQEKHEFAVQVGIEGGF